MPLALLTMDTLNNYYNYYAIAKMQAENALKQKPVIKLDRVKP